MSCEVSPIISTPSGLAFRSCIRSRRVARGRRGGLGGGPGGGARTRKKPPPPGRFERALQALAALARCDRKNSFLGKTLQQRLHPGEEAHTVLPGEEMAP